MEQVCWFCDSGLNKQAYSSTCLSYPLNTGNWDKHTPVDGSLCLGDGARTNKVKEFYLLVSPSVRNNFLRRVLVIQMAMLKQLYYKLFAAGKNKATFWESR